MITKTLYTCKFYNTDYTDKEKAKITKFWKQQQL